MLIAIVGTYADRLRTDELTPTPEEALAGDAAVSIVRAALLTPGVSLAIHPALAPLVAMIATELAPPVPAEAASYERMLSIMLVQPHQTLDDSVEAVEPFLEALRIVGGGQPIGLRQAMLDAKLIFLLGQEPSEFAIRRGDRLNRVIYFRSLLPNARETELLNRLAPIAALEAGEDLVPRGEGHEIAVGREIDEALGPFTPFGVIAEAVLNELLPDRFEDEHER